MAVLATDLKLTLTGGSGNTNPTASTGGAASVAMVDPATLFDQVSRVEAAAGRIEYRCIALTNTHASEAAEPAEVWISTQTTSPFSSIGIGAGTGGVDNPDPDTGSETAAPAGVSFTDIVGDGVALVFDPLPAGSTAYVWLRRTVQAGAENAAPDMCVLTLSAT